VTAPPQASVGVHGCHTPFPIRRIYCVGRNYAAHAREMGADPIREKPFFFMKAADSVRANGVVIAYPPRTSDLQHEVEMVVALAHGGQNIDVGVAMQHVFGYAVGIDLTRRDLQAAAKQAGHPWETGKSFDGAAPMSDLRIASTIPPPTSNGIRLSVNATLRQTGSTADMIWSVAEIIAELSTLFELQPGDLIFTGTPSGVGPLHPGDRILAEIDGVSSLSVAIGQPGAR
jgi:fumarylpyruvate hydrolase